jgi:hypothetical protein
VAARAPAQGDRVTTARLALAAALTLAAAIAVGGAAAAEEPIGGSPIGGAPVEPHRYESPQWFAFELKFGPYSPNIDSSPGLRPGATPFADLFPPEKGQKRPPGKLLTEIELDFQFLHKFGSLGLGHSIGYYRRTTSAFQLNLDANGMATVPCVVAAGDCVRSGDQTALNVLPLQLMLVYRFDVLALRYKVPFVPYVKIGIAYYIWWIENGGGSVATATNPTTGQQVSGYGGTFGWTANPGMAFMLDVIDPSAARTMDTEVGINHTYLFAELNYADITGFGAKNKLVLSDLSWTAGLAFEF